MRDETTGLKMDAVDTHQEKAINALQSNQAFMFVLILINTAASIAQILECWKIWRTLK